MLSPERLDEMFPDRHREAERLGINPSLRAFFVPLPRESAFTEEQCDVLFPNWRGAMRAIVQEIWGSEVGTPALEEEQATLEAC